jgi:hypothetical protein
VGSVVKNTIDRIEYEFWIMKANKKNQLPGASILNQSKDFFDFVETYYLSIGNKNIELNGFIFSFFKSIPEWLQLMFNYRLKKETMDGSKILFSQGDIIGPFHLFRLLNNEAVLGINTKHLDYRISLFMDSLDNHGLYFSTTFTLNSCSGKYIFIFVKTIYRLATPHILQTMIRYLYSVYKPQNNTE